MSEENKCEQCGNEISDKVKEYSEKHYSTPLCMPCQDKRKKEQPKEQQQQEGHQPNVEEETVQPHQQQEEAQPQKQPKGGHPEPQDSYFMTLQKVEANTKQIEAGGRKLTYISWAEAWRRLKEHYPDATYHVHENTDGMPYFADDNGAFVKVSVTVRGTTHDVYLPVMDRSNRAMKKAPYSFKTRNGDEVRVAALTTADINKTIQRALTKAIAMHGCGLYVYQDEDHPTSD